MPCFRLPLCAFYGSKTLTVNQAAASVKKSEKKTEKKAETTADKTVDKTVEKAEKTTDKAEKAAKTEKPEKAKKVRKSLPLMLLIGHLTPMTSSFAFSARNLRSSDTRYEKGQGRNHQTPLYSSASPSYHLSLRTVRFILTYSSIQEPKAKTTTKKEKATPVPAAPAAAAAAE